MTTPQHDLFQSEELLRWLPDETLFSLVSRHHYFWGHTVAARTSELLFGHVRSGAQHDFASHLQCFVERTRDHYGDAAHIVRERTLIKFYLPFLPSSEIDNAVSCMAGNSVAHLKLRLGILTSRFRANHPLKACTLCMEEDRRDTGWAYWHLAHQYPGVWGCLKHASPLRQSTLKSTGVQRFQWILPNADALQDSDDSTLNEASRVARLTMAQLVTDLVSNAAPSSLHGISLHEIYRAEIQRRGWMTAGGSLRMPQITASFLEHMHAFDGLAEFAGFPKTVEEANMQLGRLLRPPRSGTHPLRHLLTMHWLFGSWRAFEAARQALHSSSVGEATAEEVADLEEPIDSRKLELLRLVQDEELSFTAAAQRLDIDVATAMAWATKAGIAVARRPKKLTEAVRTKAIRQLRHGADKTDAAATANVSIQTITRLLLTEVGLHAAWTQAREERARLRARKTWTALLASSGHLGIKLVRSLDLATYAWLYRNDRAWLTAHRPAPLALTAYPRASSVDWAARDATLSQAVRQAALHLVRVQGVRRVFLWQLYQQIPELKAKAHALDKLPLTQRAIAAALQSNPPSETDLLI